MRVRRATAERAQTMAEYSIALGVITIVIVLTLGALAGTISGYLLEITEFLVP